MSVDDRLTDLEIRFAYQSQVIATLDEVVREFATRVEQLERQLAALGGTGGGGGAPVGSDERPPHY
jgi:uncharacterized coiled-coil protein SlyX